MYEITDTIKAKYNICVWDGFDKLKNLSIGLAESINTMINDYMANDNSIMYISNHCIQKF